MRFDLIDLRLFLHVLEVGSITRGAKLSNLALPSASARLRGMEDTVGLPLLERRARGVHPTAAGDALAHHARVVLGQIDRMTAELDEYATGRKGAIRLLTNSAAMTELLPDALGPYLARQRGIAVDVEERSSAEIVTAIAGGFADVGIISSLVDHGELTVFECAIDQLVVVVPRESPLATHRHMAFKDVISCDFVGLTAGSPLQEHLDAHARRAGQALTLRLRVRTFEAVCRLVADDVGIGIVPETAARRYGRSMAIRSIRLSDAWARRPLAICIRSLEALPQHARELVEHLSRATPQRPVPQC